MRAIVIHKAKDLRIEETSLEALGSTQIRIQLANGGICGSDLHYYQHGGFGPIQLKQPMILGHEVSGYVAEIGEQVDGFSTNDLVAISPSRPCYDCQYCHKGQHNHCENMRFYGSAMPFPHIQGAFREEIIVDASQCVLAQGLSPQKAAMAEPLSVCLHAVKRAGDLVGKRVLISGSGPIGTLCVLAARAAGATEIIATDLTNEALSFAKKVGANHILNIADDPDGLKPYQGGKGYFDVHFECSGSAQALAAGIASLRPKGVLMQLGLSGDMTIPMQALTAKEIDLRGSFRFHEEFSTAVAMMQNEQIDVTPLISHILPLSEALIAFEIASDRTQSMKVQIAFNR